MPWKIFFLCNILLFGSFTYCTPITFNSQSSQVHPFPKEKKIREREEEKTTKSNLCGPYTHLEHGWFPRGQPLIKKTESFHTRAPGKALGFFNCLSHLWSRRAFVSPGQARKPQSRLQLFLPSLVRCQRCFPVLTLSVSFSSDPILESVRWIWSGIFKIRATCKNEVSPRCSPVDGLWWLN